ncbi:uncharacterized protein AC631_02465 [Debaryomyces fabryi]|uniref:OTU domain-containing protein n=1 Tax=Debaryomyces fabryi TaxID=58627 RepID=A0A0V1PZS8_9ASCO|nr:uncharacterized protein AC631_02465 [Debaryomyces fabryi]KSA01784.1 hypothetical protein AC631_02465 [Debaryomyces fabryi]CUM46322.1 unnamed protein product [Debaryomyces fabryi]
MSEIEATATESRDEMVQRHKVEQKNLMATITGMKKQATKKTRKGVISKCNELQESLNQKHKKELSELDGNTTDDVEDELRPEDLLAQMEKTTINDTNNAEEKKLSAEAINTDARQPKRNRQKERLAKRNAKIEQMKDEARKESENDVDYRKIEQESMQHIIERGNLVVYEIKPDGHCLFASIQDQLSIRHPKDVSIQELRDTAALYMKSHPDDFIPFLFDEATNSLRDLTEYTNELTTTAMWGSDMEIMALANEYDCPITVLMAGGSPITINPEGSNPELKLAFYKHSFGLGEHYNSLRDM